MIKYLFLFALTIFLFSCANIVAPTGGIKDTKPPEMVSANPPQGSLYFHATTVKIRFNEFVEIENPTQLVLVSPPLSSSPKYSIRNKSLIIKLNEALKPNTTYNIFFGDAIKDYTEGNLLSNFQYVFSTGNKLDSALVSGQVTDAQNSDPLEGVYVMLYKGNDSSAYTQRKPDYLSKTNKDGFYSIHNIAPGTYLVFALKDANLNYIYDDNSELVGLVNEPLSLVENENKSLNINMFKNNEGRAKLLGIYNVTPGVIQFCFSSPIRNFKFDSELYTEGDIAYVSQTKDTVTYYYSKPELTDALFYTQWDDNNFDTTKVILKEPEKLQLAKSVKTSNSKRIGGGEEKALTLQDYLVDYSFSVNNPIKSINNAAVQLFEDSALVTGANLVTGEDRKLVRLEYSLSPNKNYLLKIGKGALVDFFGNSIEANDLSFKSSDLDQYGKLIITNSLAPDKGYILKMYDEQNRLLQTFYPNEWTRNNFVIDKIISGKYIFRLIEDLNQNKIWDTGSVRENRLPEKVLTVSSGLVIRPNWEAELELKTQSGEKKSRF